jgi:hypothetical protein
LTIFDTSFPSRKSLPPLVQHPVNPSITTIVWPAGGSAAGL